MFTMKRSRMATRPTTCPKPGTSHSPFSSGSHLSVLVTVEAFQADLALSEQLIDLDARGQTPVKLESALCGDANPRRLQRQSCCG